jgi:hypothetical protein
MAMIKVRTPTQKAVFTAVAVAALAFALWFLLYTPVARVFE